MAVEAIIIDRSQKPRPLVSVANLAPLSLFLETFQTPLAAFFQKSD